MRPEFHWNVEQEKYDYFLSFTVLKKYQMKEPFATPASLGCLSPIIEFACQGSLSSDNMAQYKETDI